MNKQKLLDKIDQAWTAFTRSYAGLNPEHMIVAQAIGEWSVKDVLAHVTTWEQEALKYLPIILQGQRLPRYSSLYGGIDAFNALMSGQKQGLSPAEVLTQLEETHQALIDFIRSQPDDGFAALARFQRRIQLDTYGHYPIHTQAILDWRARQSSGADLEKG